MENLFKENKNNIYIHIDDNDNKSYISNNLNTNNKVISEGINMEDIIELNLIENFNEKLELLKNNLKKDINNNNKNYVIINNYSEENDCIYNYLIFSIKLKSFTYLLRVNTERFKNCNQILSKYIILSKINHINIQNIILIQEKEVLCEYIPSFSISSWDLFEEGNFKLNLKLILKIILCVSNGLIKMHSSRAINGNLNIDNVNWRLDDYLKFRKIESIDLFKNLDEFFINNCLNPLIYHMKTQNYSHSSSKKDIDYIKKYWPATVINNFNYIVKNRKQLADIDNKLQYFKTIFNENLDIYSFGIFLINLISGEDTSNNINEKNIKNNMNFKNNYFEKTVYWKLYKIIINCLGYYINISNNFYYNFKEVKNNIIKEFKDIFKTKKSKKIKNQNNIENILNDVCISYYNNKYTNINKLYKILKSKFYNNNYNVNYHNYYLLRFLKGKMSLCSLKSKLHNKYNSFYEFNFNSRKKFNLYINSVYNAIDKNIIYCLYKYNNSIEYIKYNNSFNLKNNMNIELKDSKYIDFFYYENIITIILNNKIIFIDYKNKTKLDEIIFKNIKKIYNQKEYLLILDEDNIIYIINILKNFKEIFKVLIDKKISIKYISCNFSKKLIFYTIYSGKIFYYDFEKNKNNEINVDILDHDKYLTINYSIIECFDDFNKVFVTYENLKYISIFDWINIKNNKKLTNINYLKYSYGTVLKLKINEDKLILISVHHDCYILLWNIIEKSIIKKIKLYDYIYDIWTSKYFKFILVKLKNSYILIESKTGLIWWEKIINSNNYLHIILNNELLKDNLLFTDDYNDNNYYNNSLDLLYTDKQDNNLKFIIENLIKKFNLISNNLDLYNNTLEIIKITYKNNKISINNKIINSNFSIDIFFDYNSCKRNSQIIKYFSTKYITKVFDNNINYFKKSWIIDLKQLKVKNKDYQDDYSKFILFKKIIDNCIINSKYCTTEESLYILTNNFDFYYIKNKKIEYLINFSNIKKILIKNSSVKIQEYSNFDIFLEKKYLLIGFLNGILILIKIDLLEIIFNFKISDSKIIFSIFNKYNDKIICALDDNEHNIIIFNSKCDKIIKFKKHIDQVIYIKVIDNKYILSHDKSGLLYYWNTVNCCVKYYFYFNNYIFLINNDFLYYSPNFKLNINKNNINSNFDIIYNEDNYDIKIKVFIENKQLKKFKIIGYSIYYILFWDNLYKIYIFNIEKNIIVKKLKLKNKPIDIIADLNLKLLISIEVNYIIIFDINFN